jgi:hypothetical protein
MTVGFSAAPSLQSGFTANLAGDLGRIVDLVAAEPAMTWPPLGVTLKPERHAGLAQKMLRAGPPRGPSRKPQLPQSGQRFARIDSASTGSERGAGEVAASAAFPKVPAAIRPQHVRRIAARTIAIRGRRTELKIIGHQFVKGFASAPVNFRRGRVDQVAVAIERAEKTFFIKSNTWLNPSQRIPIDEK